ncbi:MAG: hypothetical protein HY608_02050 [Planctomycetes bacterium]|nr:hypothetical protein [Planctomycetota bacterium]
MDRRFDYRQGREIAEAFGRHGVEYLFLGKSGAIILGFPETTQDADLFVRKSPENGRAIVAALVEMGFPLDARQQEEIRRGKDFVQIRTGPFDLDLVFAPDGIETFEDAKRRSLVVEGMAVCHIDDIIRSKEAAHRAKDVESLPRLKAFRDWWVNRTASPGSAPGSSPGRGG